MRIPKKTKKAVVLASVYALSGGVYANTAATIVSGSTISQNGNYELIFDIQNDIINSNLQGSLYNISPGSGSGSSLSNLTGSDSLSINSSQRISDIIFQNPAGSDLTVAVPITFNGVDSKITFSMNSANDTLTLSGALSSDEGTLVLKGPGTVAINANNGTSLTGYTSLIDSVNLQINQNASLGGQIDIAAGSSIDIKDGGTLASSPILNNGSLKINTASSLSFPSLIQGSGSVTINPDLTTGEVTFTTANTYTGQTKVSAGSLKINNSQALASTPILLGQNATIEFAQNADITYAGSILKDGNATGTKLLKSGSKILELNGLAGSYTYASTEIKDSGKIVLRDGWLSDMAATSITVSSGSPSIEMSPTVNTTFSGNFIQNAGTGYFIKSGTAILSLSGTNAFSGSVSILNGTLAAPAAFLNTPSAVSVATGSTFEIDVSANQTFANPISGLGDIVLKESNPSGNTLSLTGSLASYGGNFTLQNKSKLKVSDSAIPQAISLNTIDNTVDFDITSSSGIEHSAIISGLGAIVKSGTGKLILTGLNTNTGDTLLNNGTLELQDLSLNSVNIVSSSGTSLIANIASDLTFDKVISGSGSFSKQGNGILRLDTPSTYTGTTTVNDGALKMNTPNALSASTAVTLTNTGILDLNDQNLSITSLSSSQNTILDLGSATLTLSPGSGTTTHSGKITGTGHLVKNGSGRWILNSSVTDYSGTTTINNGVVQLGDTSALGTSTVSLTGGTLDFHGISPTNTITSLNSATLSNESATEVAIPSNLPISTDAILSATSGNMIFNGTTYGVSNLTFAGSHNITTNNKMTVDGNINVTTSGTLIHNNTLVAFGNRTYTPNASTTLNGNLLLAGSQSFTISTNTINLGTNAHIGFDERHIGSSSLITGSPSAGMDMNGIAFLSTNNINTPYGKTLVIDALVTGYSGSSFVKNSLGKLSLSQPVTTDGAISVTRGTLEMNKKAMEGNSQNITLSNFSSLVLNDNTAMTFSRNVSGNGHVVKNGSATLNFSSNLWNNGNLHIQNGEFIFSSGSTYRPSALAKISVDSGAVLSFKGTISPTDSIFNPSGSGTINFNGASINDAQNGGVQSLTIGSPSQAIVIGASGLGLNFGIGNKVFFDYQLNTTGNITKTGGSGVYFRGGAADTHTGDLIVNEGWIDIDDAFTASNSTNIGLGSQGTLNLSLSSDKNIAYSISGLQSAVWNKEGSGAAIFNTTDGATNALTAYQGQINVKQGRLYLNGQGATNQTVFNISRGAVLDLAGGTTASRLNFGSLNLDSQSTVRIIQENAETYINLNQISGSNGSILAIQFRGSPNSQAPIVLDSFAQVAGSKMHLQFRPISSGLSLSDGAIYPLISKSGANSLDFSCFRMMPSIRFSPAYTTSGSGSADTSSAFYGNLIEHNDTLYIKINTNGFYSGLLSGSPASTNAPQHAYVYTYLLEQISLHDVPWYSAFDQFVTSVSYDGTNWVYMSPLMSANLNQAFLSSDFGFSSQSNYAFQALGTQMIMNHMFGKSFLSKDLVEKRLNIVQDHLSLQSDVSMKNKGRWKGWTQNVSHTDLSHDSVYVQNLKGEIIGLSYQASDSHVLGYQNIKGQIDFNSRDHLHHGQIHSNISQASQEIISGWMESHMILTQGLHHVEAKRIIEAPIQETLQKWTAQASYEIQERGLEQDLRYKCGISEELNVSFGVHYKISQFNQSAYQETGADDLNLRVSSQKMYSTLIGPKVQSDYYYQNNSLWSFTSIQCGYDYYQSQNIQTEFGLKDYQSSVVMPFHQPERGNYYLGINQVLGFNNGMSFTSHLKVNHNGEAVQNYQAGLSVATVF